MKLINGSIIVSRHCFCALLMQILFRIVLSVTMALLWNLIKMTVTFIDLNIQKYDQGVLLFIYK
jgi:hypothetical protein